MPQQAKKSLVISIYFALAVSTLLVFWQVRNFDFVNYDDDLYVYQNQHVLNGLTADAVSWAFTTGHSANWHPLTWLPLMIRKSRQIVMTSTVLTELILDHLGMGMAIHWKEPLLTLTICRESSMPGT